MHKYRYNDTKKIAPKYRVHVPPYFVTNINIYIYIYSHAY